MSAKENATLRRLSKGSGQGFQPLPSRSPQMCFALARRSLDEKLSARVFNPVCRANGNSTSQR